VGLAQEADNDAASNVARARLRMEFKGLRLFAGSCPCSPSVSPERSVNENSTDLSPGQFSGTE
jgi:hypothetical protein